MKKIIASMILLAAVLSGCSEGKLDPKAKSIESTSEKEEPFEIELRSGEKILALPFSYDLKFGGFVDDHRFLLLIDGEFSEFYYYNVNEGTITVDADGFSKIEIALEVLDYDSEKNTIKLKVIESK